MTISPARVLFDVSLIVLLPYFGVYIDNNWTPPVPGIRCHDPRLSYPKKDNTISPKNVTLISGFLPIIFFLMFDVFVYKRGWTQIYQNIVTYCVGIDLVFLTNNLVKYNLGWPRPYFLQVCDPDYSKMDCSTGFILNPPCRGDPLEIKWASLTFPSLHSSSTTFGMTYLIAFLYQRKSARPSSYVINMCTAILTCVSITWSVFVVLSRVNDHRHHISDVMIGSLWGLVFAVVFLYQCSGLYTTDENRTKQDSTIDFQENNELSSERNINKKKD